ncbi:MAG TPA: transcription antitermination factor NusB [Gammaproteobacteria bacterium]|nr:transcription antitermination factor NusB [Gammaproteobacteria bacterium]
MSRKKPTDEQLANQRRHMARRLALQAIYQWQITGHSLNELMAQFSRDQDYPKADPDYFRSLVAGVLDNQPDIDEKLKPFLPRDIELVDAIERAMLRLAVEEFSSHPETPYRVVLNEAIDLVKLFGAVGAHRFINGVLEKLWRDLRPLEAKAQLSGRSAS